MHNKQCSCCESPRHVSYKDTKDAICCHTHCLDSLALLADCQRAYSNHMQQQPHAAATSSNYNIRQIQVTHYGCRPWRGSCRLCKSPRRGEKGGHTARMGHIQPPLTQGNILAGTMNVNVALDAPVMPPETGASMRVGCAALQPEQGCASW